MSIEKVGVLLSDEEKIGEILGIDTFIAHYAKVQPDPTIRAAIKGEEERIMEFDPDKRKKEWCRLSPRLAWFSRVAGTYLALEQLYKPKVKLGPDGIGGAFDRGDVAPLWYEHCDNARAVRERLAVSKNFLAEELRDRLNKSPLREILLVSLGAGSGRSVIETLGQFKGRQVKALLLDIDQAAQDYSNELARAAGVDGAIKYTVSDVKNMLEPEEYKQPADIVEIVGLLDYFRERTVINLLKKAKQILTEGGVILASNIVPNDESKFIRTAVGWLEMKYRTLEQFVSLFLQAGFKPENCKIHMVPSWIYTLVEARNG